MEDPVERPSDMLYHAGISNPDDELEFLTVTDYEKFMKDNNLYKEGARRIIITGQWQMLPTSSKLSKRRLQRLSGSVNDKIHVVY